MGQEAEPGRPCIFPFTDTEIDKTCRGPKCCNLDNDEKGAWCSTRVDEHGNHVKGHYGYCSGTACEPGTHFLFYIFS